MTSRWLLDTSALLALRDNEEGAERVASLLQAAQSGESRCKDPEFTPLSRISQEWLG